MIKKIKYDDMLYEMMIWYMIKKERKYDEMMI